MATTCHECNRLDGLRTQQELGAARMPHDAPTRWWHCQKCNRHINRYRGDDDLQCDCGAWYNTFGGRLRDDWMSNPAWRDDDIDDLEGYELSQLAKEVWN